MKKTNKLILSFMLMFVCIFGFNYVIHAENLLNEETLRIEVEGLSDTNQQGAYIRIYDAEFDEDVTYGAIFTDDRDSAREELGISDINDYVSDLKIDGEVVIKAGFSSVTYLPLAEKYGDMYVTFYVPNAAKPGYYEKISNPILIEKPENLKISKRFRLYPNEDETAIYYNNLGSISTERIVNYKIGKVTDKTILNQIKNGNYSGLESLMSVARKDTNSVSEGTIKVNSIPSKQPTLYKQTDIVEGAYYYIYLELDDEDGKYYELDDVNLYQCLNNNGNLWLTDVDSNNFTWNLEETEWDKFITSFKNHEMIKEYKEEEISFYIDESKFVITLNSEGSIFKTEYNYKDGIVSYVFDESKTEEDKLADLVFNQVALEIFANKFNYNIEEFGKYIEKNPNLTIDKDGFEYEIGKIYINEQSENASIKIDSDCFKKLKFNIINGSKSFENRAKTVENPKTGFNAQYGMLTLVAILAGAIYLLIRKYSKFPKHN